MRIFCVYGIGSCGKTTTLKLLASNPVLTCIEKHSFEISCLDEYGIYKLSKDNRDYYILIGTAGDSPEILDIVFTYYESIKNKYTIDTIIVPTRTKGSSCDYIWGKADSLNVPVIMYSKGYLHPCSQYDKAGISNDISEKQFQMINEEEAELILNMASM